MKYLLITLIMICGCSKDVSKPDPFKAIGCAVATQIGEQVAFQVSAALQCQGLDAVKASVAQGLVKVKICEAKAAPSVSGGNPLCLMAGGILIDMVMSSAVPADWKCSGGVAKDKIVDAVNKACDKLK